MGFFVQDDFMAEELGTPPPFRRDDYETFLRNQPSAPAHIPINTNTYMSIGLFAMLLSGIIWLTNTIYSAKTEITTSQMQTRNEFSNRMDRLEQKNETLAAQVKAVQSASETWSYHDMFKWCVHLQRDNPQIKIPEPEAPK